MNFFFWIRRLQTISPRNEICRDSCTKPQRQRNCNQKLSLCFLFPSIYKPFSSVSRFLFLLPVQKSRITNFERDPNPTYFRRTPNTHTVERFQCSDDFSSDQKILLRIKRVGSALK